MRPTARACLLGALVVSGGPYDIPNARGRARAVKTNNPFTEAMRGVGANQVCFAYEAQMDELAARLGMNPLEFREMNFITKGETLMQNQPVPSRVMLPELAAETKRLIGRPGRGRVPEKDHGPWRVGVGVVANMGGYGQAQERGRGLCVHRRGRQRERAHRRLGRRRGPDPDESPDCRRSLRYRTG